MPETAIKLLESKYPKFVERFKGEIVDAEDSCGDLSISVHPGKIREVIRFLKEDSGHQFKMLLDLFGMDYSELSTPMPERYAVVYIFYSFTLHEHLRLKVYLPEKHAEIDSIHDLYKAANWNEREAWDLFGIKFRGHPNLIRILCHNEFVGHPLRKDYPSDQYQRLKTTAPSTGI